MINNNLKRVKPVFLNIFWEYRQQNTLEVKLRITQQSESGDEVASTSKRSKLDTEVNEVVDWLKSMDEEEMAKFMADSPESKTNVAINTDIVLPRTVSVSCMVVTEPLTIPCPFFNLHDNDKNIATELSFPGKSKVSFSIDY